MHVPPLPYELRIGVTGHRRLDNETEVESALRRVVTRIGALLSETEMAPLAWTANSALARGADCLFAEVLLDMTKGRLEVVIPFDLEVYRQDFADSDDLARFDRLYARSHHVERFEASWSAASGLTSEQAAIGRQEAYRRAGEYLVSSSEILVAIWDGKASSRGGTGDIVEHAVQLERVVIWIDATSPLPDAAIVQRIEYGRDGRLDSACTAPFPVSAKQLSLGYHQQARYCLDQLPPNDIYDSARTAQREELVAEAARVKLPADALDSVLAGVVPHFVRADLLALAYQKRHMASIGGVLYLASTAVTVAVWQVLFFPEQRWVILFEILSMLSILALWQHARREAWHEKWLHDRFLAERLRAAMYTTLAGVTPGAVLSEDPLPFYQGPQHWLTLAAHSLAQGAVTSASPVPFAPLRDFITSAWLRSQEEFHTKTARRTAARAHKRHSLGIVLFGGTLLMAFLHLVGVGHSADVHVVAVARADLWITLLALSLPAWAGAVHAVTSQLELERVAERSKRMARVLGVVVGRAERARDLAELQDICRDADALMVAENREWWVLLSFQRPKLQV